MSHQQKLVRPHRLDRNSRGTRLRLAKYSADGMQHRMNKRQHRRDPKKKNGLGHPLSPSANAHKILYDLSLLSLRTSPCFALEHPALHRFSLAAKKKYTCLLSVLPASCLVFTKRVT